MPLKKRFQVFARAQPLTARSYPRGPHTQTAALASLVAAGFVLLLSG
jgi:hypothetical protein